MAMILILENEAVEKCKKKNVNIPYSLTLPRDQRDQYLTPFLRINMYTRTHTHGCDHNIDNALQTLHLINFI